MSKNIRLVAATFFLVLAVVIGVYQFKLNSVEGSKTTTVVVAKVNIFRGDEITAEKLQLKKVDVNSIVKGSFINPSDLVGKIAAENFRENEQILSDKIVDKNKWSEGELRLISISGQPEQDTFAAFEVRPLDHVDLFYLPKQAQGTPVAMNGGQMAVENLKPVLEDMEIIDLKNAEGVSYKERAAGTTFTPKYALVWLPTEQVGKIMQLQAQGGIFRMAIHGERPSIDGSKKTKVDTGSIIFK